MWLGSLWIHEVALSWSGLDPAKPQDVERAAQRLAPKDDLRISFYRADTYDDFHDLMDLWAITFRYKPDSHEFLFLVSSEFAKFRFVQTGNNLHPFLSARHYEIEGIDDHSALRDFAKLCLERGGSWRMSKAEAIAAFRRRYPADPEVQQRASEKWKKYIP